MLFKKKGILLLQPATLQKQTNKEKNFHLIIRLWIHEASRVFSDRLSDQIDRNLFYESIKETVESEFRVKFPSLFNKSTINKIDSLEETVRGIYFGDYMNDKLSKKVYIELKSQDDIKATIETCVQDFNRVSEVQMDLTVFSYFVEHFSRMSRILKHPNGHALLIG